MTDKELFFDHMGHSEAMSKDNYQCPAGVKELNTMGKMLGHMDTCNYHCLFVKKYMSTLVHHGLLYSSGLYRPGCGDELSTLHDARIEAAKAAVDDGEFMEREAAWDVTLEMEKYFFRFVHLW